MSVVLIVIFRRSDEEVYSGCLTGILYDGVCSCFIMQFYTRILT